MNIEEHLHSKEGWKKIREYVGEDKERFKNLMAIFFHGETWAIRRCSQPVGVIGEKQPQLVLPYLPKMIIYLKSDPIDAVKRNTMRIFQFVEIPKDQEGDLFDLGMNYLRNAEESIAVKAFSMTVLRRIATKYPELATEVIHQIEILVKERVSAGIISRGQHELKKLNKILASA